MDIDGSNEDSLKRHNLFEISTKDKPELRSNIRVIDPNFVGTRL